MIIVFLVTICDAQIVITKTDFISKVNTPIIRANDTVIADANTASQIEALAAKKGQGQTWDLSIFHFNTVDTTITTVLAGTGGAAGADDPKLAIANYVFKGNKVGNSINTTWDFLTINDNGTYLNGRTKDNHGNLTNKTVYDPPVLPYAFPMKYGAKWVEATIDSTVTYQGFQVKLHVTVSEEVDGEGMLIRSSPTPNANCLRIKTTQMTTAGPLLGLTFYDTSYSYSFLNNSDLNLASFTPPHTAASPFPSQLNVSLAVTETMPVLLNGVRNTGANNSFDLHNSPNPFSSVTTINYSLASSSYVKIVVHNMLGKEIAILMSGFVGGGNHSLNFDSSKLSAGCYYYTITANGISQTKQMVFVR